MRFRNDALRLLKDLESLSCVEGYTRTKRVSRSVLEVACSLCGMFANLDMKTMRNRLALRRINNAPFVLFFLFLLLLSSPVYSGCDDLSIITDSTQSYPSKGYLFPIDFQ